LAFNLNERTPPNEELITYIMTALLATIAIRSPRPTTRGNYLQGKRPGRRSKTKKRTNSRRFFLRDLVTVYADGMHNLQQELDGMSKTEMKSFDLTDFNVVFPNKKTAIITYKAKIEGQRDGKDVSGTLQCWLGLAHC